MSDPSTLLPQSLTLSRAQHPAMRRAFVDLKASKDPQVTTFILSNANSVYIDTILKHYGVENAIDEVVTNPAQFRDDGLLELRRRVDPSGRQHQCKVGCSPNMCKGACCACHRNSIEIIPN